MNDPKLNLLVLYSANIEKSHDFYQTLGLQFVKEKHGRGPEHYASQLSNLVLELYPGKEINKVRLGFSVDDIWTKF